MPSPQAKVGNDHKRKRFMFKGDVSKACRDGHCSRCHSISCPHGCHQDGLAYAYIGPLPLLDESRAGEPFLPNLKRRKIKRDKGK